MMQTTIMLLRSEEPSDAVTIAQIIRDAFAGAPHSSGTEAEIVNALRRGDALTLSLVAVQNDEIVGHLAISPVSLTDAEGWYGLGPVSVTPQQQRSGIGTQLIREALWRLKEMGANGCVVLGEPAYYQRFGFRYEPKVTFADVPPPYFQIQSFNGEQVSGSVAYHAAFDI